MRNSLGFIIFLLLSDLIYAATPIKSQPLSKLVIYPESKVPAEVKSINSSVLSSEVQAKVMTINKKVGDYVKKNQVLVNLDATDHKYNLEQQKLAVQSSEANLKFARWQYKATQDLVKSDNASQQMLNSQQTELRVMELGLEQQRSRLKSLTNSLDKYSIKSPYTGVITQRIASLGELLNPGSPILKITDLNNIELEAKLHPDEVSSLKRISKRDSNLRFIFQKYSYPVNLRTIVPVYDQINKTQVARFIFSNKKSLPGTAGTLMWQSHIPHLAPQYIHTLRGKTGIFIVKNKRAKFIPLAGIVEGRPAPLPDSINLKTQIITKGYYALKDNTEITYE